MIWMTWSELLYESTINSEKNNKKEKKEIFEKINKNKTKTEKKIESSQWIENTSTIKKQIFSRTTVKKKTMFSLWEKKT